MEMKKSPRPKPNPRRLAPAKSPRPMSGDDARDAETLKRAIRHSQPDKQPDKMAKGGKISEYGGKETYKSKSAMMKHEKAESPSMERKERMMGGGKVKKMAMGGSCRGMGAAKKGGQFRKDG